MPKIYSASSTLLFSQESDTLSIVNSFGALTNNGNNKIDIFIELIRSRQSALKIVEKLQLQTREEFKKIVLEGQRVADTQNADETTQWLDGQLLTLSSQIEGAETELEQFMQTNGLIDLKSQVDLAKTEISKMIEQRLTAEDILSNTSATMSQINAANGNADKLMQVPIILNNPLLRTLNSDLFRKQLEFDELSKRYK